MPIIAWAVLLGCYLLFAGQPSWSEAAAGVPAAGLATAFLLRSRNPDGRQLAFRPAPWGRLLGAPLAALLPDAARVGRVLLQTLWRRPPGEHGEVQAQPFLHGDGAWDAGRRGAATLGVSFAPNGFVLDIPGGADAMLVHRLRPVPPRPDRAWPL